MAGADISPIRNRTVTHQEAEGLLRQRRLTQSWKRPVAGWSANRTLEKLSKITLTQLSEQAPDNYEELLLLLDSVDEYLSGYQGDALAELHLPSAMQLAAINIRAMRHSQTTMELLLSKSYINWDGDTLVVNYRNLHKIFDAVTRRDLSVEQYLRTK